MADDRLILEHLRAVRTTQDERSRRFDRVETRMASVEHTLGHVYATAGDDRAAMQALTRWVERIERQLEMTD